VNAYAVVIGATLLGVYLLNTLATVLNTRGLSPELPAEFQGTYDAEKYRRSQEYTRVKARFEIVESAWGLAVLLIFWGTGGFAWLDGLVRSWGLGWLPTGMFFIGLLMAGNEILSLPFAVYSTFVIEERFGFNKTTPRTFVTDRLKGYAIGIVIGGALLAGVLWFLHWAGDRAWIYVWLTAAAFVLILQFVAPTWIMPLFNKFTPLGEGELKSAIFRYAQSVNFSLKDIFVMDGSRRSSKGNAFFTGFGRSKRIALFDTLVEKHTLPEMVAVLAHEIGHYKKGHILKSLVFTLAQLGVLAFLLSYFIGEPKLFAAFGLSEPSAYAGLVFFLLLYSPVSFLLSLALHAYSRRNEYEADRYAADTYGRPDALADALKKLSVSTLSNLTPHPLYVFLHYTHPPVLQRVAVLRGFGQSQQP